MEKSEINAVLTELGLTVDFVFVPYSVSRNYKKDAKVGDMSLNWKGTVKKDGREVVTVDYSAGIGHCPSYKQQWNPKMTVDYANTIKQECEQGFTLQVKKQFISGQPCGSVKKPILPDPLDFFYSISMDCDVMEQPEFEEWASNFGYDVDSRAAEKIYNECLKIAMKINAAIGSGGLEKLREAFEDY